MTQISELFSVLVDWVVSHGGEMPGKLPGLWRGETVDWTVVCNGSPKEEREGVPPASFVLRHKTALLGMAIVNPFGGVVTGPTEAEMIEHFKALINARTVGAG